MKRIIEEYTFENFIVGESNAEAYKAVYEAATLPHGGGKPVFIYGGSGIGKTHLINAFANEFTRRNEGAKVCLMSTEEFVSDMMEKVRVSRIEGFRSKYELCDALVLDDLQCINGMFSIQLEIFLIVCKYIKAGKPVILTTGSYMEALEQLEDCLINEFPEMKFSYIDKPEVGLMHDFIRRESVRLGLKLSDEEVNLYASSQGQNFTTVRGNLHKLQLIRQIERNNI